MKIIEMLLKEMEQEAQTTRRMLALIPTDKFSWKPHEKSMNIQQLSTHIAELSGWVSFSLATDELDFSKNHYDPAVMHNTDEILAYFDKTYEEGKAALSATNEAELEKMWTMRNGEIIYSVRSKAEVVRMAFCQTVHHRAQLGVYFRLLDIALPGSYGPTADYPNDFRDQ